MAIAHFKETMKFRAYRLHNLYYIALTLTVVSVFSWSGRARGDRGARVAKCDCGARNR